MADVDAPEDDVVPDTDTPGPLEEDAGGETPEAEESAEDVAEA
jgi:hypothetical protein